uniref:Uncharacterized protein n=1 Tax=Arundo donax TaxID=35708 RepID=A0A0A9GVG6_ARUDO
MTSGLTSEIDCNIDRLDGVKATIREFQTTASSSFYYSFSSVWPIQINLQCQGRSKLMLKQLSS